MDFELKQTGQEQEFKIEDSAVIIKEGARKEAYRKFYKNFKKGKGSAKKFLSIFSEFIKNCGFNLKDQQLAIEKTVLIRGLRDNLPTIGPDRIQINQIPTVPPLNSFCWSIYSDLDFTCNPSSVNVECFISIGGVGGIDKKRIDNLLRLIILGNYPELIKVEPKEKGYLINIDNYLTIKTNLILLAQTISSMNEITISLSESIGKFIQDMINKKVHQKFLDNLI